MCPKARNPENKPLPKGWRFRYNAYYYRVPASVRDQWDGKAEYKLGSTLVEAHEEWARRMRLYEEGRTIAHAMDKFLIEMLPSLAPRSRKNYIGYFKRLRPAFGHMLPEQFQPSIAYAYLQKRTSKTAAKREIEAMSSLISACVMWGWLNKNPLIGAFNTKLAKRAMRLKKTAPLYQPTDDDLLAALSIATRRKHGSVSMCQAYIRLKLLTGLRQTDMLLLQMSDFKSDGIYINPHKTKGTTGISQIIEYDDDGKIREAFELCKSARPLDIGPWLFCNRNGESYFDEDKGTANGFQSVWQRFMARVVNETDAHHFTERSLRNKAAQNADSLKHAQELLSHADERTTKQFYRTGPERVKPSKGI